ncbi:hypothetical protein [Halorussus lipolyticus]|uniref:hypothetical protein n=1 Tax=Halorussus lipolyticus TaxID=3034024 RepID=UPI0023E86F18|nr:hypothetical protein [Halorussus sp. DT80]
MSRTLSVLLSWLSSFVVACLVGSALKDRRTGITAGLVSATIAAAVSWLAYDIVDAAEERRATETTPEPFSDDS